MATVKESGVEKIKLIIQKKSNNIFILSDFGLIIRLRIIEEKTDIINHD